MFKLPCYRSMKPLMYVLITIWTLVVIDFYLHHNSTMISRSVSYYLENSGQKEMSPMKANVLSRHARKMNQISENDPTRVNRNNKIPLQKLQQNEEPVQQIKAPVQRSKKPVQQSKAPVQRSKEPVQQSKAPVQQTSLSGKQKSQTNPIILVWKTSNYIWSKRNTSLNYITEKACGSCRVTTDRSTIKKSIAVILFNHNELLTTVDVPNPKTRSPEQVYVFWSVETPSKSIFFKDSLKHPKFDSIFNLTMTYENKSDIRQYFGTHLLALERSKRKQYTSSSVMKLKKKLAIWVASNCRRMIGTVERTMYAKSLVEAGLNLDKYGKCFDGEKQGFLLTDKVKEYKFYLAFENSLHCPDYITEKFWRNSLSASVVPVVWGPTKEDVMAVAPPNSYIHVEDFKTPRHLVNYLNYLDKNDTAYLEYHKWRDAPVKSVPPDDFADHGMIGQLCRLCRRQVKEHHQPKTIPSIYEWFYETGYPDDKCLRNFTTMDADEREKLTEF